MVTKEMILALCIVLKQEICESYTKTTADTERQSHEWQQLEEKILTKKVEINHIPEIKGGLKPLQQRD
jgi:hypothetical protein